LRDRLEPVRRTVLHLLLSSFRACPRSVHSSAPTENSHLRPAAGITPTNYYYLHKIGFVPQIRGQAAPSCVFRNSGQNPNPGESRNLSRCTPSSFFQASPESAFRPLPRHRRAALIRDPIRAQFGANPTGPALAKSPHNSHKKQLLIGNWLPSAKTCIDLFPPPLKATGIAAHVREVAR
jgi:hypothetical protein